MAETTQLKTLILTESAGKARTIKKFLGRQYLIMSTDGFLKDLPKSRLGIDAENGYAPEYITVRGKSPLLKEIEKAALNARRVYFATNPDAQGEFLAGPLCKIFGVNSKSNCRRTLSNLPSQMRDRLTKTLPNLSASGKLSTNSQVTKSANIFPAKFIAA